MYCDTLFAIALDQNGQALPEVSLNFQLDTQIYDGVIYPINSSTGLNSEPGTALYCPQQGFVGTIEVNVNHSTTNNLVQDDITINYIDDNIGVHQVENTTDNNIISLHLYLF